MKIILIPHGQGLNRLLQVDAESYNRMIHRVISMTKAPDDLLKAIRWTIHPIATNRPTTLEDLKTFAARRERGLA